MFRELCGDRTLKNVIIVTNMWGKVSLEEGEARLAELASQDMFFKPVLDKGGQLVRHDNTLASAQAILQCVIRNHPLALRIQEELVDEHKDLSHTAAGEELNRELILQARRHANELRDIRDEMQKAIQDRDEETRKELEEESMKLQTEMTRIQTESQQLAARYYEEKARLEREINETRENERREREKAAAEHYRQMEEITKQLQNTHSNSESEKAELRQRLDELQRRVDERPCTIQ
jgi:DNA repair exonuclease SbcCD ATPase subunit